MVKAHFKTTEAHSMAQTSKKPADANPSEANAANPSGTDNANLNRAAAANPSGTDNANLNRADNASPSGTAAASPSEATAANLNRADNASPTRAADANPTMANNTNPSEANEPNPSEANEPNPSEAEKAPDYLSHLLQNAVSEMQGPQLQGRVVQVQGTMIKAIVPRAKVGELCVLHNPWEDSSQAAEVVGFEANAAVLMPFGELVGISADTLVLPQGQVHSVPVGEALLGRVLDGLGRPLDVEQCGPLKTAEHYPVYNEPPSPLRRKIIDQPLELGVRALDGLLTCGEGQRMGIFAPAGGGKSTLLAQVLRNTNAEIVVLALIGERGREVREFLERDLGTEGLKRSITVVSTSDRPALERLKAAYVATAVAEYFRDKDKKVLLMMDSVTRFARAQREVGLAAGEPPARRGFPPSVFATLPKLMERSGRSDKGSITALYTVLVEGDDMTEPVADETRSILDGHIILSRKLASANHYPAIDILRSISRVMGEIVPKEHTAAAGALRSLMAKHEEIELLVRVGEYQKGADKEADKALEAHEKIETFLQQGTFEKSSLSEVLGQLQAITGLQGKGSADASESLKDSSPAEPTDGSAEDTGGLE